MKITDFSFFAFIFWSTLLMGGMYALRRLYCVKSGFNLRVMLGLYFLCMLRAFSLRSLIKQSYSVMHTSMLRF